MLAAEVAKVVDWLNSGAHSVTATGPLMADFCERLVAGGLPLWRVGLFVRTLHPDVLGRNFIWKPDTEVVVGAAAFDVEQSPQFRNSPLAIVFAKGVEIRHRLDDPAAVHFPFYDDMRAEGVTDYIALPLLFVDGSIHATSWTTKQPGGFSDEQLAGLRAVIAPMARLVEIIGLRLTASVLLDTYVGNRAGERILAGQIRRGHTETMHAAIWLSDLRGFTPLSDRLPAETVVEVLNRYFDCQVGPIRQHGGEVLKFMGDGLLAVFPIAEDGGDAAEVCGRVMLAAREARTNIEALRYADADHAIDSFRFGLALHVGKVLYGNIGGGNRLDFTCIGPAVNLAARLEKIAARLHLTIVASAGFAQVSGGWSDLGEFPIAGFAREQRVYGLADEVPVDG
jgi:adenylate cyclase